MMSMMLGGGYNHGYYNNYYSNNQCFGGCPPGAHCEWGFCECNRGRSSIHLSYLQPFMLRKITKVGYADVSAVAHRCASSAYWTKRIFPLLTHKLPFWIHFSKSLGSEPQLTNINYVEYVEVSSLCVNEAREYLSNYLFQELTQFPRHPLSFHLRDYSQCINPFWTQNDYPASVFFFNS